MACRLVIPEYWTLKNKLQWNFYRKSYIFFDKNVFKNVVCKISGGHFVSGQMCWISPCSQLAFYCQVHRPFFMLSMLIKRSLQPRLLKRHLWTPPDEMVATGCRSGNWKVHMKTLCHGKFFQITDVCWRNPPVTGEFLSHTKCQLGGLLMFSLFLVWKGYWTNHRVASYAVVYDIWPHQTVTSASLAMVLLNDFRITDLLRVEFIGYRLNKQSSNQWV